MGHACGGFGTKIHAIVDAPYHSIDFTLSGSGQSDIGQATELLKRAPEADAVIADKAYDSDALIRHVETQEAQPIIPPRSNRTALRGYGRHRYKARNLVERFFNPRKQFRRIATRYEKLSIHFAAIVTCGCIVIWLK